MAKVKINWFQQEIDSPDRNWDFIRNQGNLVRYLHNRFQWFNYPRMSKVGPFPLHVDIEITAKCNLGCPMCPRRHADISQYGHMPFDLYTKIVDECARNNLFSVRYSWRGEPLVHPEFKEFLRYIKLTRRIPNVSFLTNGRALTEDIAACMIETGLDYISFSVDGSGEIYNKIRKPQTFDEVYAKIQLLKDMRDREGKRRPQIRVSGLWPAIAQDPDTYFQTMSRVADKIVTNPLKDFRITKDTRFVENYVCQYPWERLFIGFDGRTQPCSNAIDRIYIGDVSKQSVAEVWQGRQLQDLRTAMLEGRVNDFYACSRCSNRVDDDFKGQLKKDWSNWSPEELRAGRHK